MTGHIYESSGNLREELPSETDRNLISGSTSGSSESDVSKPSTSDGQKESEGTLVLENSDRTFIDDPDQMKHLDENITELHVVVANLVEKESLLQNLTHSLLYNASHINGGGDWSKRIGRYLHV